MKLYMFCFLLMFLIPGVLPAQNGAITGVIADPQGQPISDVRISLHKQKLAGYSDPAGRFHIYNIPPGVYQLVFKHVGYEVHRRDSIRVAAGQTVDVGRVVLTETVLLLSGSFVTATQTGRTLADIPVAATLVPRELLEERNGKTSAEVLREESGIFVQKTNHGGGSAIIRGLSSNQILLLVDGVRLNNSTYRLGNHQYLTTVDNNALERIEVVHGPTSVLYGSDALGGVINLITRRPPLHAAAGTLQSDISLFGRYASADGERTGRAELSLYNHRWALLVGASRKHFGDLRRGGNSDDPEIENSTNGLKQSPSGFDGYDLDAKLVFVPTPRSELLIAFQQFRQDEIPRYDKYESGDNVLWLYSPQHRQLSYGKFTQHFEQDFLKQAQVTLSFNRQEEGRITQKGPEDDIVRERDRVNTYGLAARIVAGYKGHQFSLGGEVYLDDVASRRVLENPHTARPTPEARGRYPDGAGYQSFGVYIQDEWHLSARWMVLPGVRFSYFRTAFDLPAAVLGGVDLDNINLDFSALTASIGSMYRISPVFSLTANAGQAFRAPNLSDLSKFGESKGNTFEVPNAALKPEKLLSVDAGIRWNHSRMQGSLVGYYAVVSDLLGSVPALFNGSPQIIAAGDTLQVKRKENIGKAYLSGFEFSFNANLRARLSWYGNAAYTYGQSTTADEPISKIPPFFGLMGLRYHYHRWQAAFYARFAARQNRLSADDLDDPRIPNTGTPGWYTLNLRGNFQPTPGITLTLALENVLDKNYREHASGINGPGRNLVVSLRLLH